jgi:hypothetical protein
MQIYPIECEPLNFADLRGINGCDSPSTQQFSRNFADCGRV